MRRMTILLLFFSISTLAANSNKEWALRIIKWKDSRIDLESCGTNNGTYYFSRPTQTTQYTCSGKIINNKTDVIVIKKISGSTHLFLVDKCGEETGVSTPEYGDVSVKCEVHALEVNSLTPIGDQRIITFRTAWEYSLGSTTFSFKMNDVSYFGVLTDFDTLRFDSEE